MRKIFQTVHLIKLYYFSILFCINLLFFLSFFLKLKYASPYASSNLLSAYHSFFFLPDNRHCGCHFQIKHQLQFNIYLHRHYYSLCQFSVFCDGLPKSLISAHRSTLWEEEGIFSLPALLVSHIMAKASRSAENRSAENFPPDIQVFFILHDSAKHLKIRMTTSSHFLKDQHSVPRCEHFAILICWV